MEIFAILHCTTFKSLLVQGRVQGETLWQLMQGKSHSNNNSRSGTSINIPEHFL